MRMNGSFPALIFIVITGIGAVLGFGLRAEGYEFLAFIVFGTAIFVAAIISYAIRVADQWNRAVVLRLGKFRALKKRPFTRNQFRDFMFAQSKPYPQMLGLVAQLKAQYGQKVVVISNESREVNAHRIRTFRLDRLVDAFIASCFVGMRKPDVEIFRLALDLAQTPPERAVFIDNTPMFVEIAERLGMGSIHHNNLGSTRARLASLGLQTNDLT